MEIFAYLFGLYFVAVMMQTLSSMENLGKDLHWMFVPLFVFAFAVAFPFIAAWSLVRAMSATINNIRNTHHR